ncbi:hypothetical protein ACQ4PT_040627 [Festuca glaucescens]
MLLVGLAALWLVAVGSFVVHFPSAAAAVLGDVRRGVLTMRLPMGPSLVMEDKLVLSAHLLANVLMWSSYVGFFCDLFCCFGPSPSSVLSTCGGGVARRCGPARSESRCINSDGSGDGGQFGGTGGSSGACAEGRGVQAVTICPWSGWFNGIASLSLCTVEMAMRAIDCYGTENKNLTLTWFLLCYLHCRKADDPRCLAGLVDTVVHGAAFNVLLPRHLLGVAVRVVGEDEEGGKAGGQVPHGDLARPWAGRFQRNIVL